LKGKGESKEDLLKKSEKLIEEAVKDLEMGCYNKAVSAAYFSVKMTTEHLLKGLRTTKDDKVANALKRLLLVKVGEKKAEIVRRRFLALFEARKLADHRPRMLTEEEAEKFVKMAIELRKIILEEK